MRGDQLARQRPIIHVIEASSNGLTLEEIAQQEENWNTHDQQGPGEPPSCRVPWIDAKKIDLTPA
jgi:hypothetical protein